MSMYQQKNSMGLGLGGWCVEERDNSVVCPKPRRLGLSDPSFHDHHFRPSLRWPIMYVQIPLYSFPYMKNKFLFFLLLLLLFCLSDFGVGFFAVKFSVIKLRSEIQKQERSFWILFSQRFISLCVCVWNFAYQYYFLCVCVFDLWVILDVYFIVSEKFMLDQNTELTTS